MRGSDRPHPQPAVGGPAYGGHHSGLVERPVNGPGVAALPP